MKKVLVHLCVCNDNVVDAAKVAEGIRSSSAFEDLASVADCSLTDGLFAAKLVIIDSQLHNSSFFDDDSAGAVVVLFGVARGDGVFVSFGLDGGSTCGEFNGNVGTSATTCEPFVVPSFTVAFGGFHVKGLDCHFVRSVTTIADCFGDNFAFDDELFNLTEGFEGQLFSCEQRGRNTASSEGTHQVGLEADVCCTVVVTNFDSEANFSVVFEDKLFADVRTVLFELGCTSVVEFVSHERGGSDFEDDECVGAFATSASFAEFFVFEVFLVVFVSTCGELVALAEADVPATSISFGGPEFRFHHSQFEIFDCRSLAGCRQEHEHCEYSESTDCPLFHLVNLRFVDSAHPHDGGAVDEIFFCRFMH